VRGRNGRGTRHLRQGPAKWIECSGPVAEKARKEGIALPTDHPEQPRAPGTRRGPVRRRTGGGWMGACRVCTMAAACDDDRGKEASGAPAICCTPPPRRGPTGVWGRGRRKDGRKDFSRRCRASRCQGDRSSTESRVSRPGGRGVESSDGIWARAKRIVEAFLGAGLRGGADADRHRPHGALLGLDGGARRPGWADPVVAGRFERSTGSFPVAAASVFPPKRNQHCWRNPKRLPSGAERLTWRT